MQSCTSGLCRPRVAEMVKRILIVDDASLMRLYYREALMRAGYQVSEALNGLEALEKLLIEPPDLLIVDVNMPRMNGLAFLKSLRRHEGSMATIPALMISTEAGKHDADAARAAGANYYLIKPVSAELLLEHVTLLCGPPR
jgi:two-component system, chemotaxis family, chemotaxis protein CheY